MYLQSFRSHGTAKLKNNQITVKKEYNYFVKTEPRDGQMFVCENINVAGSDDTSSTHTIRPKLKDMKIEFEEVTHQLESIKKEHHLELLQWKRKCLDLTRENKTLTARIKQLQTDSGRSGIESREKKHGNKNNNSVLGERNAASSDSSGGDVYEVDQILSHKTLRGKKLFLIRWKGFDPSHDTWERKENLNCPRKLQNYFAQN